MYLDEAERYAKALEAIGATRLEIVASRGSLAATRVTPFAALTELRPAPAVDAAFARVGPIWSPRSCSPRARPASPRA